MKHRTSRHNNIEDSATGVNFSSLLLILLVMALTLNACNSGISPTYIPPAATETAYDYFQKIDSLTAEAMAAEKTQLESIMSVSPDSINTVKLALLLTHQKSSGTADEATALSMLEQLATSSQAESLSNDYRILATQWLELLQHRRKVRETVLLHQQTLDALNQLQSAYGQLDERYLGLARVLASLEEQNTLLAKQNVLMQKQIEALTVIEQQLADREQLQGQQ